MTNKRNRVLSILFPVLCLLTVICYGTAGAGSVTETGVYALQNNPAAVNVEGHFINFNLEGGMSVWNNLFFNDHIEQQDSERYVEKMSEKYGFLAGNNFYSGLNLGIGPVTGFVRAREDSMISLPYKIGELLLYGNEGWEEDDVYFSLDETEGSLAVYGDTGVNFSYELPREYTADLFDEEEFELQELWLGASYHYMMGMLARIQAGGDLKIEYDEEGFIDPGASESDPWVMVKYNDPAEGDLASGHVFDFGLYSVIDDRFSAGISLIGLGSMSVTGVYVMEETFEENNEPENGEQDENDENGDEPEYDPDLELKWKVPTEFKAGVRFREDWYQIYGDYALTSYHNGLNDSSITLGGVVDYVEWLPVQLAGTYSTMRNDITLDAGLELKPGPVHLKTEISDLLGVFNRARSAEVNLNIGFSY